MDLDYLLADNYSKLFGGWLAGAEVFNGTLEQLQAYCAVDQPDDTERPGDLVYKYPTGKAGWERTAAHLKPMLSDVREGTPAAQPRCRGRRLFLQAT